MAKTTAPAASSDDSGKPKRVITNKAAKKPVFKLTNADGTEGKELSDNDALLRGMYPQHDKTRQYLAGLIKKAGKIAAEKKNNYSGVITTLRSKDTKLPGFDKKTLSGQISAATSPVKSSRDGVYGLLFEPITGDDTEVAKQKAQYDTLLGLIRAAKPSIIAGTYDNSVAAVLSGLKDYLKSNRVSTGGGTTTKAKLEIPDMEI